MQPLLGGLKATEVLMNGYDALLRRLVRQSMRAARGGSAPMLTLERENLLKLIEATVELPSSIWVNLSPTRKEVVAAPVQATRRNQPPVPPTVRTIRLLPTINVSSTPCTAREKRIMTKVNEALRYGREHLVPFKNRPEALTGDVPKFIRDIKREHERVVSFVSQFNVALLARRRAVRSTIVFDPTSGSVQQVAATGARISPQVWGRHVADFLAEHSDRLEDETLPVLQRRLGINALDALDGIIEQYDLEALYRALRLSSG